MSDAAGSDPLLSLRAFKGDPPAVDPESQASRLLTGRSLNDLRAAQRWHASALEEVAQAPRELPSTVNPRSLRQTGWGLIVPKSHRLARCAELKPLLDLRRRQTGGRRFKIFDYLGEDAETFLADRGEHLGTLRLHKVPYFLLLAADPEEISFEFQYHLGLSHAVGRIAFEYLADYGHYARSLVASEGQTLRTRSRHVGLFSVENDHATEILARHLTDPVIRRVRLEFPQWRLTVRRRSQARREALLRWLQPPLDDPVTPGLILASSHGRRLPAGAELQERLQGSVVCLPHPDRPAEKNLLSADDLPVDAYRSGAKAPGLGGTLVFLFGCYGAGLPVLDSFPHATQGIDESKVLTAKPKALTVRPFLAALPKALLLAGAGAVVGHIDRGWTTSYLWSSHRRPAVETTDSLLDTLTLLLRGHRLGHALVPLRRRHHQLGAKLAQLLDVARSGGAVDLKRLGLYWIGVNDARNLIVVGDPAVFVPGRPDPTAAVELSPGLFRRLRRHAAARGEPMDQWVERRLAMALGDESGL